MTNSYILLLDILLLDQLWKIPIYFIKTQANIILLLIYLCKSDEVAKNCDRLLLQNHMSDWDANLDKLPKSA